MSSPDTYVFVSRMIVCGPNPHLSELRANRGSELSLILAGARRPLTALDFCVMYAILVCTIEY